ncbi:MAG: endonuclease III domain-containing protein [Candidatus Omnitrophica bacterium]|nr:endonuclease III domain-containing protein [Candidatus Omnitrophota bacterium]
MANPISLIYEELYRHFGAQHWWPAKTRFEVMVGAILTQNTNWSNVERAINNLKKNKSLAPHKLRRLPRRKLARLIKSAGYYNIKAKRLKEFLKFLFESYQGNIKKMCLADTQELRRQLLSVNGIGPETADSMLLYALDKPVFVVDSYTKRILSRHRFIRDGEDYDTIQNLFMRSLKKDIKIFNEFHALLVRLGKDACLKNKPRCDICPLRKMR